MKIKVGTRGSKLALIQTKYVCGKLKERYPQHEFEIVVIKTKGDMILDRPLDQIGDKGLFVKEIEEMILSDKIQLGVHSMKDMPAIPARGLVFAKPWKREDPRDALILREQKSLEQLPLNAVIATGSKRRAIQLRQMRPDLNVVGIRGNVDTRLRKMEEQKLDGIVLAAAGLIRLGMKDRITAFFSGEEMIPAPAQGVLALEVREDQEELLAMLNGESDPETIFTACAERRFLDLIGGDCHMPIGAYCRKIMDETYELNVCFGRGDKEQLYFASVRGDCAEQMAEEAARRIREQAAGRVYLLGGGPGEAELVTVKGQRLLSQADCIVYDRLSSPELLACAKEGCETIYVGKADRNHTMKQEEINRLLVRKAMQHDKVVRLKGGDAYVFGRGGEEAMELREAGISFEMVPGISSSLAGPAYAGIPVTMRGLSSGFHVVTAHSQKDQLADIDFEAMAASGDTCVFLMGLGKVGEIADALIKAGKKEDTKAAVISRATTARQKTCTSDLAHIADLVEKEKLESPALIVVGDVVSCREKLNFFEERPLFGKHFLTPVIGNTTFGLSRKLREKGAWTEEIQVGRIEIIEQSFSREELEKADWLIFTSKNGVNGFFAGMKKSGLDARALANAKIAAIGGQTKKCLEKYGLTADLVPEEFHSDALCLALLRELDKEPQKAVSRKNVWYCKAEKTDNNIEEALQGFCTLKNVPVYRNVETKAVSLDYRQWMEYDAVFFTSASSVRRILGAMEQPELYKAVQAAKNGQGPAVFSIGPKSSRALEQMGMEGFIEAGRAEYLGMVKAAEARFEAEV